LRQAFIETLCELAANDQRILLLTGDLGYMVMEPFLQRFPDRFLNVGVAEQNMIGLATGLAESGFRPYAYSIATFAALRAFEFIRNGPVLHRLPVRIVGMGMGFEYGHAGPTHYAVEDIGALRTLPGLTIVAPADSGQAAAALRVTAELPGPVYYSLGKDDRSVVRGLDGRFEIGRVEIVRRGGDLAIVALGSIAVEAVAAAERLASAGVEATVAIVSSFNPDPSDDLAQLLAGFPHVISVEAQTVSGSLGALVGSVIASEGIGCRLHAIAVRSSPDGSCGPQQDRWRKHGLDRDSIFETALKALDPVNA
jgi:transketolase